MALRDRESIEEHMLYKKGAEREFYKAALGIVGVFTEEQIILEKDKVLAEIARLEFGKSEAGNTINDKKIDGIIKPLRNKYKMFNYLLI